MIRRKGRDLNRSLELGNSIDNSKSVRFRRLTISKACKYLSLIFIGVIVHSGYRIISQHFHKNEIPEETIIQSSIEKPNNEKQQDQESNDVIDDGIVKKQLQQHAQKIFQEARDKQIQKDEIKRQNENDIFRENSNIQQEKENQQNALEDELMKGIGEKIKQQKHNLNDSLKNEAIQVKFNPASEDVKKELKSELDIEHKIAKLMDEGVTEKMSEQDQKIENKVIEDLKDPNKIVTKDPKFHSNFIDKASQIADAVQKDVQRNVLSQENHHSHDIPALVTAVSQETIPQVEQLVESLQYFYPKELIYVFDLNLNAAQRRRIAGLCKVRMRGFWMNLFPRFVHNLKAMHWRPLVIQTALAEFGHITWINPEYKIVSSKFNDLVHDSEVPGILVVGQSVGYTTFAVTNPKMYKYLQIDRTKLFDSPHFEILAMIIHNTEAVTENFMKILTACAVEEQCLNPYNSDGPCDFDFSGKQYANCHKYDESAINIILKNWLGFDTSKYVHGNSFVQPYDDHDRPNPKRCR